MGTGVGFNHTAGAQLRLALQSRYPCAGTGVLKYKRDSEKHLEASGLPYTIIRPGRLTDGPYTR